MAFDACMMRAVLTEFSSEFPEAKIEKVLQPRNDEIDMIIHHGRSSRRLVFNVGPNAPRLQLSDTQKENPLKAPMFCMLLRKYFLGARIVSVTQPGFDRIAEFKVSCYDEMGFAREKIIVCEIMGKYANLIVLDEERKILAALKVIDFASSSVRQVLPGLKYQVPAMAEKIIPTEINEQLFYERLSDFPPERTGEKFITSTYSGIATQIARELVFRASGHTDTPVCNIDKERFYSVFRAWQQLLIDESYTPTIVFDGSGKPIDYSYMDISYLGQSVDKRVYEKISDMLDCYFAEKDRLEHIHQRAHDITTLLNNAVARTERKLGIQRQALLDADKGEEYKRHADLITANLYRLERGMDSFKTVDYYDESCPEIEIKLDPRLTPSQNAQKLYKLYNKCKTAKIVLAEQIEIWENELRYLESVKQFLSHAECEQDVIEIRDELYRSGYASKLRGYVPPKKITSTPHRFITSGGYELMVGRNNIQNDNLTFKVAKKGDLWFHTKDIPGSHVIMLCDGEEPSEEDYTEAASVAARYSKATADLVAVDYTRVKNIKKPGGSKPGFVIYKTNYTAFVRPATDAQIEKMKVNQK
ncbi:MAG: NFACT family protein [Clostridia bacterium]|nr:NFACT family protein [Clostridia bacterium]